jgi:hypothetical protein
MLIVALVAVVKLQRVLRAKKNESNPRDRIKNTSKLSPAQQEPKTDLVYKDPLAAEAGVIDL